MSPVTKMFVALFVVAGDEVRAVLGVVERPARVPFVLRVELVDRRAGACRSRSDRRLGRHVQPRAVGVAGHRLESTRARQVRGVLRRVLRILRRPQDRVADRRLSRTPAASKCSRYGPNSSPTQNVPSSMRAIDSTSKSAPVSRRRSDRRVDRNLRGRRRVVVAAVIDGPAGDVAGVQVAVRIAERREAVDVTGPREVVPSPLVLNLGVNS